MNQLCTVNLPEKGRLPLLKIKDNVLPITNLNNIPAFIPNDILTNLKYCKDSFHSPLEGKVSNVWTSPTRREKFRHITDNPVCICGAGNDLTFLYDKTLDKITENKRDHTNIEQVKSRKKKFDDKTTVKVTENLFPSEFTLSVHHGSQSIQFYDEIFTTKPSAHKDHKIFLPIMEPNTQSNSMKLYQSLSDVLQKSGLDDSSDYKMPTTLHNLLAFVKKEQDLYNIIFHGIIKETTVDCIERGELLSNIRQRYRNIFTKVPEKIKNFHDKIVAQKILDRRLTEELIRFQNTVSLLSSELSGVQDHEDNILQMCQRAKNQLKEAVEETKTNADLLREYHSLYEQQRQRLEKTVSQLEIERDCWRTAAYQITNLVLGYYVIRPGITLVECEHNAILLSQHFVELLTTTDNEALSVIKNKTSQWCTEAQKFSLMLAIREENLKTFISKELEKINNFKEDFEDEYLNDHGQLIQPLNKEETLKILSIISEWEKSISEICGMFEGQIMLVEEEKLKRMKKICSEYTDIAVEVFNRHRGENDGSLYQEHNVLLEINKVIEKMMDQFMDQLTGDNGVADGIIALQTNLENWIIRLTNCINELFFRPISESEWIRFKLLLDDWMNMLQESRNAIGLIKSDNIGPNKKLECHEIIQSVDNWSHKSSSGIESENLKLQESIFNLKRNMVRWTSQIVLRLAPDFPNNSPEAKRAARIASASIKELQENASLLHENLRKFTTYIISCSKDIVIRIEQRKIDTQSENPDSDSLKLHQLMDFTKSWIEKSDEVMKEILELEFNEQNVSVSSKDDILPTVVDEELPLEISDVNTNLDNEDLLEINNMIGNIIDNTLNVRFNEDEEGIIEVPQAEPSVQGVGGDFNVHSKMLTQDPNEPYSGNKFRYTENIDMPPDLPQTNEAFQLIQIFEILQTNFRSLNSEALLCENECKSVELEVMKSKRHLESLEQTFKKLNKELEDMQTERRLTLPTPALFSTTNTIERVASRTTDRSVTPKSVSSSKRRAPKHSKKNVKK